MIVACLRVEFHLPGCSSLKEKRFVLRSLKDRLHNRFNVALCEIGYQDKWQRTEMAIVTVSGDRRSIDRIVQAILNFLEREERAVLTGCEKEFY